MLNTTKERHIIPVRILAHAALLVTLVTKLAAAESASAPQSPTDFHMTLDGEVGAAAEANMARLRSSPLDSVPWLRADLTGENAAEVDKLVDGMSFRPFKNYSGDISGRFIEV